MLKNLFATLQKFVYTLNVTTQEAVDNSHPQRKKMASDNVFPNPTDMRSQEMPIIFLGVVEVLNALSQRRRRKRKIFQIYVFFKN